MFLDPRDFICMAVNRSGASCSKRATAFVKAEGADRAVCTDHLQNPPIKGYYTDVAEVLDWVAAGLELST